MSKLNSFDAIREKHQTMARLIAAGHSTSEVARLVGTSEAALVRQCADPAFRNLVARHRTVGETQTAFARFHALAIAA
jgi:hypothetical protein